jgi:hypothetical protein
VIPRSGGHITRSSTEHPVGSRSAPEIVLLFKAKAMREKDERDFAVVVPLLDDTQKAWLRDALLRVHPGHAWLAVL